MRKLHVELVKLQLWVAHTGAKVCIVFEGRDGAGKGGTIKAITERVSPRVFRVIALPAPTEREKAATLAWQLHRDEDEVVRRPKPATGHECCGDEQCRHGSCETAVFDGAGCGTLLG